MRVSSFLYSDSEKIYKKVKIDYDKKIKQKIDCIALYTTESKARNYVNYLLREKNLNIDYINKYQILLEDESDEWKVLLVKSEGEGDSNIYEFDYPIKYQFNLDKKTGELSNLYLMK